MYLRSAEFLFLFKKGFKKDCENYSQISLLNAIYMSKKFIQISENYSGRTSGRK